MNDELKTRLTKYLDSLEAAGRKGADFVAEQAPETIRQMLTWGIVEHAFYAVIFAACAAALYWFAKQCGKEKCPDLAVLGCVSLLGSIGCCAGVCVNIFTMLKIWVAPNIYLIEWAASMVKAAK